MTSSTIAMLRRRSLTPGGIRLPRSASTPTAKAISVAIGIAQPRAVSAPAFNRRKMAAGRMTPPKAAMSGSRAFRPSPSSPTASSRLISRPTTKKKKTINRSLTQYLSVSVLPSTGIGRVSSVVQKAS